MTARYLVYFKLNSEQAAHIRCCMNAARPTSLCFNETTREITDLLQVDIALLNLAAASIDRNSTLCAAVAASQSAREVCSWFHAHVLVPEHPSRHASGLVVLMLCAIDAVNVAICFERVSFG